MAFATDEEIKMAHEVLLKGKHTFDETRVDIIKNDSSCYVQASPGSGKTTALLAKLVILANKTTIYRHRCNLHQMSKIIRELKT